GRESGLAAKIDFSAPLRLCERKSRFLHAVAPARKSWSAPPGRIALARGGASEGSAQLFAQQAEIALYPAFAANQHMIVVWQPLGRQSGAEQFAETALHPVADDRVADFPGDGHAIALAQPPIGMDQQHETGTR